MNDVAYFDAEDARDVVQHQQRAVGLPRLQSLPQTKVHFRRTRRFFLGQPCPLPQVGDAAADALQERHELVRVPACPPRRIASSRHARESAGRAT